MAERAKILIIGHSGQVASELARGAWPRGVGIEFRGRDSADLASPASLETAIAASRPRVVINAGAYTAVDKAESEKVQALIVNRDGPAALAAACARADAALIHISTDYVFNGAKEGAYVEDDAVGPLSVYGQSKEAGERLVRAALPQHVILRTEWVYSKFGQNFVKTMLRLGAERDELRIVADQRGCPDRGARHRRDDHRDRRRDRCRQKRRLRHVSLLRCGRNHVVRFRARDFRGRGGAWRDDADDPRHRDRRLSDAGDAAEKLGAGLRAHRPRLRHRAGAVARGVEGLRRRAADDAGVGRVKR